MKAILDLLLALLGLKSAKAAVVLPFPSKLKPVVDLEPWEDVNWAMPDAKISKYFTVQEALWLNTTQVMAIPTAEQRKNIWQLAQTMDKVRVLLGVPLRVTSWLRPTEYNKLIGGARNSEHINGSAIDVIPQGMSAEAGRRKLLPHLEELGLRMEDNAHINGGGWIHLDKGAVKTNRFFKP